MPGAGRPPHWAWHLQPTPAAVFFVFGLDCWTGPIYRNCGRGRLEHRPLFQVTTPMHLSLQVTTPVQLNEGGGGGGWRGQRRWCYVERLAGCKFCPPPLPTPSLKLITKSSKQLRDHRIRISQRAGKPLASWLPAGREVNTQSD